MSDATTKSIHPELSVLLQSGVVLSAFSAVLLNLFFNGLGGLPSAAEDEKDEEPAPARA